MPPLSPAPAALRSGSMSAWRKSCATVRPSSRREPRHGRRRRVDDRETGDLGDEVVSPDEPLEGVGDPRVGGALAERRDRGDPHRFGLTGVERQAQQRFLGDGRPHETQGLHEPCPRAGFVHAEQTRLDADDQVVAGRGGPLLEGALGEHPGESAAHDHAEQATHRVGTRQHRAQRPRRMLADERTLVGEQSGEQPGGLGIPDLGERVRRRDGRELVVAGERDAQHPQRAHARVAAGLEREVVGETHRVDDRRCVEHLIQGRLNAHPQPPATPIALPIGRGGPMIRRGTDRASGVALTVVPR